jgi:hypothetical protein
MNYLEERASKNYLLYPHLTGKHHKYGQEELKPKVRSSAAYKIKDYDYDPVRILPAELDVFQRNQYKLYKQSIMKRREIEHKYRNNFDQEI